MKEVQPKQLILSDGTNVPYGLLVWSTGVGPSQLVKALDLPKSPGGRYIYQTSEFMKFFPFWFWMVIVLVTIYNRIGVDEWLRVPSVEDVFALGDCAGFLEQTGKQVLPALAQVCFFLPMIFF